MYEFTSFYIAVICVTSVCLIVNSFLIYFATSLEYLAPITVLSDLVYYFISGQKMIENQYGCTFYGFTILFIYQYEIVLSSLLSMQRLSKIKKSSLYSYAYRPIMVNLIVFTVLLIACAATNTFSVSAVKISCLLDATKSVLASITYHYSILSCLIGVGLLVYSYYCLANEITGLREIMTLESEPNLEVTSNNRSTGLKKATVKVYLILSIYGACMLGSLICLLFESTFKYNYGGSFKQSPNLISAATLLFVFGMISNTLLVLTLHTGIAKEGKHFIRKLSSKYLVIQMCIL